MSLDGQATAAAVPPSNALLSTLILEEKRKDRNSGAFHHNAYRIFAAPSADQVPAGAISNYGTVTAQLTESKEQQTKLPFANAIYAAGEGPKNTISPSPIDAKIERSTISTFLLKQLMNRFRDQSKRKVERISNILDEVRLFSSGNINESESFGYLHALLETPPAPSHVPAADSSFIVLSGDHSSPHDVSANTSLGMSADSSSDFDKTAETAGFLAVEKTDSGFKNIVNCIIQISATQNCLSKMIQELLPWRAAEVQTTLAARKATMGTKKTDHARAHNDERIQLSIEFVFCCTILALLEASLAENNLEESLCRQLESLALENFKPVPRPEKTIFWERRKTESVEQSIYNENKKQIGELYCSIVSTLSQYRLKQISSLFFQEVGPLLCNGSLLVPGSTTRNADKAVAITQGIRFLRLQVTQRKEMEASIECVSHFLTLLGKASTKSDIRQVMIDTLGNILEMLVSNMVTDGWCEYSGANNEVIEWHNMMRKVFDSTEPKRSRKSTKDMLSYPLMVCSLCLCDKEYFFNYFSSVLNDHLLKNLHKTKAVGVDLIRLLLEIHLIRFPEISVDDKLSVITPALFSKKDRMAAEGYPDALVDFTCTLSRFKLDYVMKYIMTSELLRADVIIPERCVIGLRALLILSRDARSDRVDTSYSNYTSYKKTLRRRQTINVQLGPFMPHINSSISYMMLTLDNSYGNFTLLNNIKSTEPIQKANFGQMGVELLRRCFYCIPFVNQLKWTSWDFVTLLAKYLNHIDESLRTAASGALSRIMMQNEASHHMRCTVVAAMVMHILSIPDNRHVITLSLMKKLDNLLQVWDNQGGNEEYGVHSNVSPLVNGSDADKEKQNLKSRVESMCLLYLCSPLLLHRRVAFDILLKIRTIAKKFLTDKSDGEENISIMDVIDQSGRDVMHILAQDGRFKDTSLSSEESVESLATVCGPSTSLQPGISFSGRNIISSALTNAPGSVGNLGHSEYQTSWTYCLGELVRLWLRFCPTPVHLCSEFISTRLSNAAPTDESRASQTAENEIQYLWWRNYIVFATSAATKRFSSTNMSITNANALRDLFNHILPHLKSTVEELRLTAVTALERTNPNVLDILSEAMKPLELEYGKKSKTKRKDRHRLRNVVCFMYNRICDRLKPGALIENDSLRKHMIAFLQEVLSFLTTENEFILDSLQFLRYHFCYIVISICRQLSGREDLLDRGLRRDLFWLFHEWSFGSEMLSEDQTKRKMTAIGAQSRETETVEKIQERLILLQSASCLAISAVLIGPMWEATSDLSTSKVCQWINGMLNHKLDTMKRNARVALHSFCRGNVENPNLLNYITAQCYSRDGMTSRGYFIVLCELYSEYDLLVPFPTLLNLILFKTGDKMMAVRRSAIVALKLITFEASPNSLTPDGTPTSVQECIQGLESNIPETFLKSQLKLAGHLAEIFPEVAYDLLADTEQRLEAIEEGSKRQMLLTLLPWSRLLRFNNLTVETRTHVGEQLLAITLRYADSFPTIFQEMWQCLAKPQKGVEEKEGNLFHICKLLMDTAVAKCSAVVIQLCKRIVTYIAQKYPQEMIDCIVSELSLPNAGKDISSNTNGSDKYGSSKRNDSEYRTHVNRLIFPANSSFSALLASNYNNSQRWPLGRGHLALVLLAELSYDIGDPFVPHLPIVLQITFMNMDNYLQPVYEHARILLLNLIHILVVGDKNVTGNSHDDALYLEEFLKSKEGKQVWMYEVTSLERWDNVTSKELANLVQLTARVLSVHNKFLSSLWSQQAILWAMNCPNSHLACRSHQIFRQLNHAPSRSEVIDLVWTLGRTLNMPSNTHDAMGMALEIIFTLQAVADKMDAANTLLLAQIMWIGVAMLHSNYHVLYCQSIELVCRVLNRVDFTDRSVQNIFRASIPKWSDSSAFIGIQPLAVRGILHTFCEDYSIKLLSVLLSLPCDDIVHPQPTRFVTNVTALLPYLAINVKKEAKHHRDAKQIAIHLTRACNQMGHTQLEEVFKHYSDLGDLETFLNSACAHFARVIQSDQHFLVFSMLFQNLQYGIPKNTAVVLRIIRHLFSSCLIEAVSDHRTRERMPQWLNVTCKYIHSPYGSDAVELINTLLQLMPSNVNVEIGSTAPVSRPYEFANHDNTAVNKAVGTVLEMCKRDKEKSVTQEMPQSFWDSFFTNNSQSDPQTDPYTSSAAYGTRRFHEMEDSTIRYATRQVNKKYESFHSLATEDEGYNNLDHHPNNRQVVPGGGLGFPTFKGFDDIMDFDEDPIESIKPSANNRQKIPPGGGGLGFPTFKGFDDIMDFDVSDDDSDD
ncbi:hypothetical protein PROFUN_03802 [Planoprotostelium fungivorum]|uniref:Uncharacterized protein n=1 Tax=Planoprotostelium fungivorum TaxID=1890364 RepID=A0A2P6NI86_9EUKA|nr:hypothetical protein PROFUN_03802 [Planoprotostelium fungivorum]